MINEYEKVLIELIREHISEGLRDKVTLDSSLINDLGLNSLGLLGLCVKLKQKLNFDIIRAGQDTDFRKIRTVRDLLNLIDTYQKMAT